jgi:nitroreductase
MGGNSQALRGINQRILHELRPPAQKRGQADTVPPAAGIRKSATTTRAARRKLTAVITRTHQNMQAIDALLQRRSARALSAPAPDEGALELILGSAATAPDHGRLRPWRFVVIQGNGRERFGDLLADHLRRTHPSTPAESLQRERQKALRAPMIVVVAAICTAGVKVPVIEQILSAGAAAHTVMLAAYALGFNSMWKTGAPAYDETVKSALGLEAKDAIVGFMYLGTDASRPDVPPGRPPERPSWKDLVQHWEGRPAGD